MALGLKWYALARTLHPSPLKTKATRGCVASVGQTCVAYRGVPLRAFCIPELTAEHVEHRRPLPEIWYL